MKTDALSVASRAVLARSQALLHLWRWAHRPPDTRALAMRAQFLRVPREEFVENHRAMVELARRHGARAVVLGPVYRDRVEFPSEAVFIASHRAALRAAMQGDGVPYLEMPELTEEAYPDNLPLFLEHIHPNHKGHRVLAESLLAYLASQGLLGDLRAPASGVAP